jgi:hypothetical protein
MEIGKPKRTITVEPIEDPVPRKRPVTAPERQPAPAPPPEPAKPPAP